MEQLDPVGHLFPEAWRGDPGSEHEREVSPERGTDRIHLPGNPATPGSPTPSFSDAVSDSRCTEWPPGGLGWVPRQSGRPGGHPKPPSPYFDLCVEVSV